MTDDILIYISLYAILRVVRVNLFLAPWCSLIWGIFWSWESEEVWHKRIFLVIKRAGTDTTFWAATVSKQSKQSSPVKPLPPPPPKPPPAPSQTPNPHPLNMSFIPHPDVQLTSFDWELLIPLHSLSYRSSNWNSSQVQESLNKTKGIQLFDAKNNSQA